ncbi:MAG: hypothetical protein ACP5N7_00955, partial [Candidatus Pacearchaeota archaeon]
MAVTTLADVNNQIQKFWAPSFVQQLKETTLLPSLVSKEYQGEIKKGGDQVTVSMINRPTGQIRTIGVDANTFDSEKLTTQYVEVKADKRIVASFEFEDLVDVQSQIGDQNSNIRNALIEACEIQLNKHLYSLVSPSTATPDHVL